MQSSNKPGKLVLPFSATGLKRTIPETSQIGITPGAASLPDGFPPLTMIPETAGGVGPSGIDMNGILYEVSAITRWANAGGGYPYDAAFASNVNVLGYPKGARVMRTDGQGYWLNTVDDNTTDPESGGAGWVPDYSYGASAITMTSSNVTLTPLQYGKPVIVITGLLTSNLNLIFPNIVGSWIVINSTTGLFLITAKTSAGTGVVINQSGTSFIMCDGSNVLLANKINPLIGGSSTSSMLELRSTSGAGTSLPATTTDSIRFTRGNNGSQELARFSPGGSYGVGDYTDGLSINQHAGDDGTTTRVAAVRAATAPLFIGMTDRTNSESGGPVGRSVVSFEGYRLANADGSRESGALRVITEGVSTDKLGARVSILTRRDGLTEADFVERWAVTNDGNVFHSGGAGGVASANRSGKSYGCTVQTISGKTDRAVIELTTGAADGSEVILGEIDCLGDFQTDGKTVAIIQGVLAGSTATKRGGQIRLFLKPDNGAIGEKFRFTDSLLDNFVSERVAGVRANGTQAPTLTISGNAITPTTSVVFVGAGLIKNITVPSAFQVSGGVGGGQITIIPTAAFTTDVTGNIALASTAVISRAMIMTYDNGTAKWYPSY